MTIARPNPQSRFPAVLAQALPLNEQYVLIDIGARGGEWPYLAPLGAIADTIGFEPEPIECERLNAAMAAAGRARSRVYPFAIAGRDGRHRFYTTQYAFSSGLYRGNEAWLRRFPFTTLKVTEESDVDAITLDRFCRDQALARADFIKIDVEGAEYDIIEGARSMMREQHVLGVFTEFWWDPVVKGQRGFADIDIAIRAHGFRFFDLVLHRYARATLPSGRVAAVRDAGQLKFAINEAYGQSFTGDALYFRDPVGELIDGALDPRWTGHSLLRLCGLLDLFDYGDCAIEILESFRTTLLKAFDVDRMIDALVPSMEGTVGSYDQYHQASIELRQMHNRQIFGLSDWVPPPSGYRRR